MTTRKKWIIIAIFIFAIAEIIYNSVYKVEAGEQVIITRFGALKEGPITEPGYHLKFYKADTVVRYPTSEVLTKVDFSECAAQLPVAGVTLVFIITDPIEFYKLLREPESVARYVSHRVESKYCHEGAGEQMDIAVSAMSKFVEEELAKCGVAVVRIGFAG